MAKTIARSGGFSVVPVPPRPPREPYRPPQQQQQGYHPDVEPPYQHPTSTGFLAQQQQHQQGGWPGERLSLAQKMGLVEAPPPAPNEEEWSAVVSRAAHRGDSLRPCAICHESFALPTSSPQVLLNCSHVFHETCLKQFEKFVRKSGGERRCPICRKAHYHKRVHYEGTAQIQRHAAAKIQAVIRGAIARKRYLKLRLESNPKFKSDYYFKKLQDMTDVYLNYSIAREKEVDRFLEEVDLQRQRAVAEMMNKADWDALRAKVWKAVTAISGLDDDDTGNVAVITNSGELQEPEEGYANCGVDCPICMGRVKPELAADADLLSCGHCFHRPCLMTFEKFNEAAANGNNTNSSKIGAKPYIPRCPLCRKGYMKQPLVVPTK